MTNKNSFQQFELMPPAEPTTNIAPTAGGSVVSEGVFKSPNFAKAYKGWQMDSEGNAEFNSGTFRGRFNIGGTVITINNSQNVQENIDILEAAGGGILYLQNGTYLLDADLLIPSGVTVTGVSRDDVIIDCNTSYSVKVIGSDAYPIGTVTIANGDTEVVGTLTTWLASMVGQSILLDRVWYEVTAVTDSTHLTISSEYQNDDLSGADYTIATINTNATIANLTITNSSDSGLFIQYAMECTLDNLIIYGCGVGVDLQQTVYPRMILSSTDNGVNLNMEDVGGFYIDFSLFANSTTGAGVVMTRSGDATFFNSSVSSNTGNGISITGCNRIAFISITVNQNGDNGIEFVSGNSTCQLTDMIVDANGADGLKLTATSDDIQSSGVTYSNNGDYGINIAASTCNDNNANGNAFLTNGTAPYTDAGTDSRITNNAGATNNRGEYALTIETSNNGAISDATNYYFGNSSFVLNTVETSARIQIPKKGVITACYLQWINITGGTLGTNETSSVYIRLNNTTDTLISNSVSNDTAALTPLVVSNTNLSISVTPGDFVTLKWTTPTWATNPTNFVVNGLIYIE